MATENGSIGHCPQCGPDRYCEIAADYPEEYDDSDNGIWGRTDHRILKCRGCGTVFHQTTSISTENVDYVVNQVTGEEEVVPIERIQHWPAPIRREKPDWVDDIGGIMTVNIDIWYLLNDLYEALNADLRVPAAIAVRTAFDAASAQLGVNPDLSFKKKLNKLQSDGQIGPEEHAALSVLVDAGSAAAHRGWRPAPTELLTMVSILEAFLLRTIILPAEAKGMQQSIPKRGNP